MTTDTYLTFQKFSDKESALELGDLLKQNDIEFVLEDNSPDVNMTFYDSNSIKEYRIKIRQESFNAANDLLLQLSSRQISRTDSDYYLFSFTDEELTEIICKPDEWSKFDYLLAQKILKDRGKEIKPEMARTLKEQRLQELSMPEKSQAGWIIAGYIFSFLGGLLGVFIGWHIRYHKKTLPDGRRVFGYSARDRKHGFIIFITGILCFLLWTILRLLTWEG